MADSARFLPSLFCLSRRRAVVVTLADCDRTASRVRIDSLVPRKTPRSIAVSFDPATLSGVQNGAIPCPVLAGTTSTNDISTVPAPEAPSRKSTVNLVSAGPSKLAGSLPQLLQAVIAVCFHLSKRGYPVYRTCCRWWAGECRHRHAP